MRRCEPPWQCALPLEQTPQCTDYFWGDAKQRHESTLAGAPRHSYWSSRNLAGQPFDGVRMNSLHLRWHQAFAKAYVLRFGWNFRVKMYVDSCVDYEGHHLHRRMLCGPPFRTQIWCLPLLNFERWTLKKLLRHFCMCLTPLKSCSHGKINF